jgi:hypothetical protein
MTAHARVLRYRLRMLWLLMTLGALLFGCRRGVLMGVMTGNAGEFPFALKETLALAEIHGLVAYIPGVVEIRCYTIRRGHAVALTTKVIDLRCSQLRRIPDISPLWRICMTRPWSVTPFTTDPKLCWLN